MTCPRSNPERAKQALPGASLRGQGCVLKAPPHRFPSKQLSTAGGAMRHPPPAPTLLSALEGRGWGAGGAPIAQELQCASRGVKGGSRRGSAPAPPGASQGPGRQSSTHTPPPPVAVREGGLPPPSPAVTAASPSAAPGPRDSGTARRPPAPPKAPLPAAGWAVEGNGPVAGPARPNDLAEPPPPPTREL